MLRTIIGVLVTGASGYLGIHCVKQLLEAGYLVRGTVRALNNPKKIEPLRSLPFASERLELVVADLEKPDQWHSALQDCTYILHTASPFPITPDETIIKTAVNGTLNVLNAATKVLTIKKIVLTSSCVAIMGMLISTKNFLVILYKLQKAMMILKKFLMKVIGPLKLQQ
uniref:3-beta hydroxysteroid dehydrogenase/isomerase domain-containing protein n=1 Tax=Panagrolaimus davidi TaxID=227884 RepID=A0A914Q2A2_9BILA